jgi:hypothetical protein
MGDPGWLEPEEGWNPGWEPGTTVLDKRSGLLMEILDSQLEVIYENTYDWDGSPAQMRFWSFRVRFFDDETDPTDGLWRPPDDLIPLTAMEVLAHVAR